MLDRAGHGHLIAVEPLLHGAREDTRCVRQARLGDDRADDVDQGLGGLPSGSGIKLRLAPDEGFEPAGAPLEMTRQALRLSPAEPACLGNHDAMQGLRHDQRETDERAFVRRATYRRQTFERGLASFDGGLQNALEPVDERVGVAGRGLARPAGDRSKRPAIGGADQQGRFDERFEGARSENEPGLPEGVGIVHRGERRPQVGVRPCGRRCALTIGDTDVEQLEHGVFATFPDLAGDVQRSEALLVGGQSLS